MTFHTLSVDFYPPPDQNKIEEYHSINSVLTHYNIPLFKKFDFKNKYIICEKNNKVFIKILYKDIHDWNNILSKIGIKSFLKKMYAILLGKK